MVIQNYGCKIFKIFSISYRTPIHKRYIKHGFLHKPLNFFKFIINKYFPFKFLNKVVPMYNIKIYKCINNINCNLYILNYKHKVVNVQSHA